MPINFASENTTIGSHTNQEAKASAARQVGFVQSQCNATDSFANKLCQWKYRYW
jgi:hypothetical protein